MYVYIKKRTLDKRILRLDMMMGLAQIYGVNKFQYKHALPLTYPTYNSKVSRDLRMITF